jgi:hypothetical protein
MEMAREDVWGNDFERLSAISTDSKLSDEEVKAALSEMEQLQAMTEKIDMIEEQLMFNYGYENALVQNNENNWVINIQAEELVNTEVVSILELVMGELDIRAENITVIKH